MVRRMTVPPAVDLSPSYAGENHLTTRRCSCAGRARDSQRPTLVSFTPFVAELA